MRQARHSVGVAIICVVASAALAGAQANVPQFRGDFGMTAGTLRPPGAYLGFFYNNYRSDQISAANGQRVDTLRPDWNVAALVGSYTFPFSIAGAHWSVAAAVPWTTITLETVNLDFNGKWGVGDIYVQPVKLGWSVPAADFVAGFGVFMPTGRFNAGAPDNTGLGMWSYQGSLGSTVYIGSGRQGSASTLVSYQIQSKVDNSDKRAGQVLTLEGGIGHALLKEVGQIGLVYYAQWKTTDDQGFILPPAFDGRMRTFALGPEITIPFPIASLEGLVTFRYYTEFGNRVSTQGDSYVISFALHHPAVSR
jgi:hypothetical protein